MNKYLLYLGALIILLMGGFLLFGPSPRHVIASDMTVAGDYTTAQNMVFSKGAKLVVKGNLDVTKKLSCEGGPLEVVVAGNATINGTIECNRDTELVAGDSANGISLVVSGTVTFGKDAQIATNGHVQIVRDAKDLITSPAGLEALYQETGENTGSGPRVGPFVEKVTHGANMAIVPATPIVFADVSDTSSAREGVSFISTAHAQAPVPRNKDANPIPNVILQGTWHIGYGEEVPRGVAIPKPPKGVHHIVLNFNFGRDGNVKLQNFHLIGPAGRDGTSDVGKSCTARGTNGEDAFRLRVQANNIEVNNFTLELGSGGTGGEAETEKDCDPGVAVGGDGGAAGNFKMTSEGQILIKSFSIVPGVGGAGGSATALGRDGATACPGIKGGDAIATGGAGGKNKKELAAAGAVTGIANITVGEVRGGAGGVAIANPGEGGGGNACGCGGGAGGKGMATAGRGGDASITLPGGGGSATGGNGGDADSHGGSGGAGGSCGPKGTGGAGGRGGDAQSRFGKAGQGTRADGTDGTNKNEHGGNGGNGGNGCGPGAGGTGGNGNPKGTDGAPGKKTCGDIVKDPQTATSPTAEGHVNATTPPDSHTTQVPAATPHKTVKAIKYSGKFIPISELTIMTHSGCENQAHWHSLPAPGGPVKATDGSTVMDPGPECGFGTQLSVPVVDVPVN